MGLIFNAVYDHIMSQRPYKKFASCYLKASAEIEKKAILEAGCGSGLFLLAMNDLGVHPEGLDVDKNMLELAAHRLDAKLYLGNICTFKAEKKWDLIYLPLDVLNYLSRFELKKALKNLTNMLTPQGELIFDVHSRARLQTMHNAYSKELVSNTSYYWRSRIRGKYVHYRIECKVDDSTEHYKLKQRVHSTLEIKRSASYAGLARTGLYRAWDLGKINRKTTRLLFVYKLKRS